MLGKRKNNNRFKNNITKTPKKTRKKFKTFQLKPPKNYQRRDEFRNDITL